ncbi:MAG: ABC transporter ATP-binding protein, partial [Atopobium sp.]|nr:ABC transporter ATP-binding protein [Atopobium sp.]
VYDNMAFGLKLRKYSKEDIEKRVNEAAEILGLKEFLQRKPADLSGGQRQRLALARALLHNSQMYIFDEATSNIDVESEDVIMQQVHQLAQTKMVLVISHRLVNVKNADQIVVMQHGRVVGSGTHQELLATNDEYKRMTQAQTELENYVKGVEA